MRLERHGLDHRPFKREASSVAAGLPLHPLPFLTCCAKGRRFEVLHNVIFFQLFIRHMLRLMSDKSTTAIIAAQILLAPESQRRFWWNPRVRGKPPRGFRNRITSPRVLALGSPSSRCPTHNAAGRVRMTLGRTNWRYGWCCTDCEVLQRCVGKQKCGAGLGRGREPFVGCCSLCTRPATRIETRGSPSFR